MKFRDPKTGKLFENITSAIEHFRCPGPCDPGRCPLTQKVGGPSGCHSGSWWTFYPEEAAHLMGYEVIDDSSSDSSTAIDDSPTDTPTAVDDTPTGSGGTPTDKNINVPGKPRLAEVLGVDIGERFAFRDGDKELPGLYVDSDGYIWGNGYCVSNFVLCSLINHPESIIRVPRLTEPEIAVMRAVGARWVSRDKDSAYVTLHREKPCLIPENGRYYYNVGYIGSLDENLFPSVALGNCIELEDNQ